MGLEIDFLAVGDANATVVRLYKDSTEFVMVVDGGNKGDGSKVIEHIRKWTWRKNVIDLLINTHPDADHVDGLCEVVDKLDIKHVWIHDPFSYGLNVKASIQELRRSPIIQVQETTKSLTMVSNLIDLIDEKGVPRSQPFAGLQRDFLDDTNLTILGPSEPYYVDLLQKMTETKAIKEIGSSMKMLESARERIDADNDQSPANNSSVIFTLEHRSKVYLFTADAGPSALNSAYSTYADLMNSVYLLQIPHHGSKRNLTSKLIDLLKPEVGIISASGSTPHHPSKDVVAVFSENGTRLYGTLFNDSLSYSSPPHNRSGYFPAAIITVDDLE